MDDTKPVVSDPVKTDTTEKVSVVEHQIDPAAVAKYAGQGDFSMPIKESPLDDLLGTKPVTTSEAVVATPVVAVKTDPKDLEKKAEEMVKDLGGKPKKKRSGAATKMALAAVLVVMMGAGGVVGMNLMKMQQTADTRSQAGGTGTGCVQPYICDDQCVAGQYYKNCYECTDSTCGVLETVPCGTTVDGCGVKCHCCDGAWINGALGSDCAALCANNGGQWGACGNVEPENCGCDSWSNGCGVNCNFPAGTQERVNQMAEQNCQPYIAMCNVSTYEVTIEEYGPNHPCYNKVDECKNPFADNSCEPEPTPSSTPTSTPMPLQCTDLTKTDSDIKLGETVEFTCLGQNGTSYGFRYKGATDATWTEVAAAAITGNKTSITFTKADDYTVQCRVCDSATSCTIWGQAFKNVAG